MPYYDLSGREISLPHWAYLREANDNHPIAQSWVDGRALRTYWRGMNLDCCGDDLALFETTIQDQNGYVGTIKRHSRNRDKAEIIHHALQRELEGGSPQGTPDSGWEADQP